MLTVVELTMTNSGKDQQLRRPTAETTNNGGDVWLRSFDQQKLRSRTFSQQQRLRRRSQTFSQQQHRRLRHRSRSFVQQQYCTLICAIHSEKGMRIMTDEERWSDVIWVVKHHMISERTIELSVHIVRMGTPAAFFGQQSDHP
ncbi:hypothetical protein SESBI_17358 [Sesbania bispinosa]|nr:hypothetical protein SESBI_17358 [Sesbania bispinosa]